MAPCLSQLPVLSLPVAAWFALEIPFVLRACENVQNSCYISSNSVTNSASVALKHSCMTSAN